MVPISATEVAKQIRVMSAWLKQRDKRQPEPFTEEAMAGFLERVSMLIEAGWTRPEPDWPRPVIVHNVTDECVFAVLPEEDSVRLQLMLVGLDRQQDPCFDTAGEILEFVAEVEKELSAIIA